MKYLVQKQNKQQFLELFENRYYTFYLDDWVFQPEYANETLQNHFEVKSLKGFGIQDLKTELLLPVPCCIICLKRNTIN